VPWPHLTGPSSGHRAPLPLSISPAWLSGGSARHRVGCRRQEAINKMRPGDGLQLGSTVALELDPESATKAAGPSANQTISFFFVCAFGLGCILSRAVGRGLGTSLRDSRRERGHRNLRIARSPSVPIKLVVFESLCSVQHGTKPLRRH
jgi:hypothetical protein